MHEFAQDLDARSSGDEFRHLVVNEHAAGGPDHANQAFDNHHTVKCLTTGLFGDFGAGDNRALGAVESANDTAGNRHEKHRDNRLVGRMLVEVRSDVGKAKFIEYVQLRGDADQDADRGENQESTENRVDAADNLVDGEEGADKVVGENATDGNPEQRGRHMAADKNRGVDEGCRRVGEDGAHQD